MKKKFITVDGNTACANIAYMFSEVAAIYPITPSSSMGELVDDMSSHGKKNLFGEEVNVIEMQSEGGASGAIHGSLSAGALTTTFTASQGLLLMIPNMHKIAGELLPGVFHVSSRSLATQALSIFGDHSDVMSARNTGFCLLNSTNVQEAQDFAAIAHLSAIKTSLPFLHFFDGFRTSSEIQKIELLEEETLKKLLDEKEIYKFKKRALNPNNPLAKVGAENPDVYFQGRETVNSYYNKTPEIVKDYFKKFRDLTGRYYDLYEYFGHPNAEKIIVSMGSSCETIHETVEYLISKNEKVGVLKVRLYRPFFIPDFITKIPVTVKKIAVLDRTKEPGSIGEPLYLDVKSFNSEINEKTGNNVTILGGRYGLSSKEFTPSMVKAVFDHLDNGFNGFTVGIIDDVTHKSIEVKNNLEDINPTCKKCKFWGFGSDGTVGANKSSIKLIGENTDKCVQGYFSYDSHKSGGVTVSHLRFGDCPIKSQYLIDRADFIALHKRSYIGRYNILEGINENGIFLINASWKPTEVFSNFTKEMQKEIINKKINIYVIDALKIAKQVGLKNKISRIMQVAFFKLSNIIDFEKALKLLKEDVKKTFKHKGQEIIEMNLKAIDLAIDSIKKVRIPKKYSSVLEIKLIPNNQDSNEFVKQVIEPIMKLKGDTISVSKMSIDGSIPTGTNKLEKRGVAETIPKWIPEKCIQCGMCSMVCPHAAIRTKQIDPKELKNKPESFKTIKSNTKNDKNLQYKVQISPEDCQGCTACGSCISNCPVNALISSSIEEEREKGEVENFEFFETLPDNTENTIPGTLKWAQLHTPLFEFSGACAGCGETPYIKLLTQLFGDRMLIANATGCSSIYGATFPTTPYTKNKEGKGPAWANSLFEDNAEYGLGFRLATDTNRQELKHAMQELLKIGTTHELRNAIEKFLPYWNEYDENAKYLAKEILDNLPHALSQVYGKSKPYLNKINELKDFLIERSIWCVGGDGWAYDIGFGGLDHVLASGKNINVLVLDTEVYSNTGGQCSKATPRGATAKFAVSGKKLPKKDLGSIFLTYENIYVASVNLGADMNKIVKIFLEAEAYNGPSIIIAYSPCIAHGIAMNHSIQEAKLASSAGYWPLYHYNPETKKFVWDSREPTKEFKEYLNNETRYKSLKITFPKEAKVLFKKAEEDSKERFNKFKEKQSR